MNMQPRALILHTTGANRDLDLAQALSLAGAQPEIVHINQLRWGEKHWHDYQMLALPGGFSYADALGAGKLFALDLTAYFAEEVNAFVISGKPVIGICNGFQALVKAKILPVPAAEWTERTPRATLTVNASGRFECRWVTLTPQSLRCVWTHPLPEPLYCPVAHAEGNFLLAEPGMMATLRQNDQVALVYANSDGTPANGAYPVNPNGSAGDIAGICNPQGNVLGLMPHPENHIFASQHPQRTRRISRGCGLDLFINGVKYAHQR